MPKRSEDVPNRPCGNPDCATSTGFHEGPTFGRGMLDKFGYWEIPCVICARAFETDHPDVQAWPFDRGSAELARLSAALKPIEGQTFYTYEPGVLYVSDDAPGAPK